jgi:hypothetical protein
LKKKKGNEMKSYWSKIKREVKVSFMFIALAALPAFAKLSLGVRFPDLVMEKLELGGIYNLRHLRGIPYVLINQSDKAVDAEIVVQAPRKQDMKDGYEPIPDANWMRVVPNKFKMEPGDVATADVILSVPGDASLTGRHFQATVLSRTTGKNLMQVGVASAVRFSVGVTGPEALNAERKADASALVNFDVEASPQTMQLPAFPMGRPVDVKKERGLSVKVANKGDAQLRFKVSSAGIDPTLRVGGYEAGDPAWLSVSPAVVKVKSNRIEEVRLSLNIPAAAANAGRKFMFLVKFELEGMDMPLELHSKLLVTTEEAK